MEIVIAFIVSLIIGGLTNILALANPPDKSSRDFFVGILVAFITLILFFGQIYLLAKYAP